MTLYYRFVRCYQRKLGKGYIISVCIIYYNCMSIYSYFKIKKINSEKLRSFKKNKTKHTLLHEFPNICTLPDSDVVDFGVPYVLNVLMRRQWT